MTRAEGGFTLIEILIALLVFSIVAVGTIATLGGAATGGFLEAFPTSFTGTRIARDYTAGSVYLQALQEFVASASPPVAAQPDPYVCTPSDCLSQWPSGAPTPPGQPYQMNWQRVELLVQSWGWNGTGYDASSSCAPECLKLVRSTLIWEFRGKAQPPLVVERFVR